MNWIDVFKIYIHGCEIAVIFALWKTYRWGRATHKTPGDYWPLESHRHYMGWIIYCTAYLFLGVCIGRKFIPELNVWSPLLGIHLYAFVTPFFLTFGASCIANGKKKRRHLHKFFVYPCIITAVGVIITGHLLAAHLHGQLFPSGRIF